MNGDCRLFDIKKMQRYINFTKEAENELQTTYAETKSIVDTIPSAYIAPTSSTYIDAIMKTLDNLILGSGNMNKMNKILNYAVLNYQDLDKSLSGEYDKLDNGFTE